MTARVESGPRPGKDPEPPRGWREKARASTALAVSPPDMDGLSSTLKRGAAYSAGALLFGQVVSFAQTLVLARLLTPKELGIFVAGTVLSGFLVSITEGGLRGALVQREHDVPRAADTVFWATGGTGVLLALVALGTAPLVGMVSGLDAESAATVVAIAAANSGTMLIHALTNVPDGLMQRRFNFKRRLIVDPARMLMFAVVAVGFAAAGYGPWSQVIGNYAGMLTWLVLSWWFAGWWPGFSKPSYRLWRQMAKFAYPMLLEGLTEKVRTSVETVLIARGLSADPLGNYRYGQRLSLIPANAVVQIGSYVLFPAFSRLAADPDRLRSAFLRGLQWAWIAAVAVAGLVLAIGEPAVVVLLGGEQWRPAGLAFVALAGFGPGIALSAAASEAIKATGRSQLLNWTTATSIGLGLGLLLLLMPPLGLIGVGLAASITELAVGVVVLVLAHRVVPYSVPAMLRTVLPVLVVATPATAVTFYVGHVVLRADQLGTALGVLVLIGQSLLYTVLFLAGLALAEPALARRAFRTIRGKLGRGGDDDDDDDGVERPDPRLDPPTMLIPVFAADETMEFGRRQIRDWGSPTAQTMVLPIIRPQDPIDDRTSRLQVQRAAAELDSADRALEAVEADDRPMINGARPVDGPTELALPARPPVPNGLPPNGLPPNGLPPNGLPPNGPVESRRSGPPRRRPMPGPPTGPTPLPGGVPTWTPPSGRPAAPGRHGSAPSGPNGHLAGGPGANGGRVRRQAPPNGGRGPRPPTPPRGTPTGQHRADPPAPPRGRHQLETGAMPAVPPPPSPSPPRPSPPRPSPPSPSPRRDPGRRPHRYRDEAPD